jgi:transposase
MKFTDRKQVHEVAKQYGVDLATAAKVVRRSQKERISIHRTASMIYHLCPDKKP